MNKGKIDIPDINLRSAPTKVVVGIVSDLLDDDPKLINRCRYGNAGV